MRVFSCGICLWVMEFGDGLTYLYWLILMMKKDNKRQCDELFMCEVLRKVWRLVKSLLMWYHVCVIVNSAMLWKWPSLHYLCEHVICNILRHGCDKCYVNWEKNENLKMIYYFKGRMRVAMYTKFRGKYRVPRWLLLLRQMHRQILPHGSRIDRQRVCIIC